MPRPEARTADLASSLMLTLRLSCTQGGGVVQSEQMLDRLDKGWCKRCAYDHSQDVLRTW